MKKFCTLLACGVVLAFAPTKADTTVVVPNANTTVSGNDEIGEVLNGYSSSTGQTVQYVITASDLFPLQDSTITGLAFRLNDFYAPSLPKITYDNFTIELSPAESTSLSMTFSANIQNGVVVFNDPFSFDANTFPTGALGETPNDFGPYIKFSAPYYYSGGDLLVTLRHSQPTGAEESPYWSVDGNSSEYSTMIGHDANATTATTAWGVVPITAFTTSTSLPENAPLIEPVPEPGTYVLIAFGFAMLFTWQKVRHYFFWANRGVPVRLERLQANAGRDMR